MVNFEFGSPYMYCKTLMISFPNFLEYRRQHSLIFSFNYLLFKPASQTKVASMKKKVRTCFYIKTINMWLMMKQLHGGFANCKLEWVAFFLEKHRKSGPNLWFCRKYFRLNANYRPNIRIEVWGIGNHHLRLVLQTNHNMHESQPSFHIKTTLCDMFMI